MFTGIIETIGNVTEIVKENGNLHINIESVLTPELKIDQSLAHNGVCLTVVKLGDNTHTITAIKETIDKSNIGELKVGTKVNLERAMQLGARLDGHIVQGHVDQTAVCTEVKELEGSWLYTFSYDNSYNNLTIEKGSITVNGVSLTVVDSKQGTFSVAIIPYTYENTNFHQFKVNDTINLEFSKLRDGLTKYTNKQKWVTEIWNLL
mgnify:CR=1 FL=1